MKVTVSCHNMQCFANRCMKCKILEEPIATGKPCPFFKTDEQLREDRQKARERLVSLGDRGKDLIEQYTQNARGYAL